MSEAFEAAFSCHLRTTKRKPSTIYSVSHLNFSILAFSTNFWPFKTDLSGNSVWPQALGFQKLAKLEHFWHFFNELLSTQKVNVARFARNVEWDYFCDFQTLWLLSHETFLSHFQPQWSIQVKSLWKIAAAVMLKPKQFLPSLQQMKQLSWNYSSVKN